MTASTTRCYHCCTSPERTVRPHRPQRIVAAVDGRTQAPQKAMPQPRGGLPTRLATRCPHLSCTCSGGGARAVMLRLQARIGTTAPRHRSCLAHQARGATSCSLPQRHHVILNPQACPAGLPFAHVAGCADRSAISGTSSSMLVLLTALQSAAPKDGLGSRPMQSSTVAGHASEKSASRMHAYHE